MIKKNPFTSQEFISVWCAHFNTKRKIYGFNNLRGLSFFKKVKVPLYINVGKNLTKGMTYQITENLGNDLKGKVCLIYDVPAYAQTKTTNKPTSVAIKKIKQYPGFLIQLKNYTDFNDYLKKTFSKSSIQKLRRYNRRLETCFNVNENMLMGPEIEKSEYEAVFHQFHHLLTKRFEDKQITNNNLNPNEWEFYKEVAYTLLLEKKAALHVIYNDKVPISIRLLYFSDNIIFDAITVFDIDYTKFHIGKISIMKMLQWSFNSEYKIFDFSKGYFDYKESWSDFKYDFEYHIVYKTKSIKTSLLAHTIAFAFKTKQYLRDKNIHEKLHKATFLLKKSSPKKQNTVEIVDGNNIDFNENELKEMVLFDNIQFLKKHIVDFQFLNSEHEKDIKIYRIPNQNKPLYLIKGENNQQILTVC